MSDVNDGEVNCKCGWPLPKTITVSSTDPRAAAARGASFLAVVECPTCGKTWESEFEGGPAGDPTAMPS